MHIPDLTEGFYPSEANFKSHQEPGQFLTPYLPKIQPWVSECVRVFRIPSSRFWAAWCKWRMVSDSHPSVTDLIEVSFPFFLRTFKPNTSELLFVRYTSPKQCCSKNWGMELSQTERVLLIFLLLFYAERQEKSGVACVPPSPVLLKSAFIWPVANT